MGKSSGLIKYVVKSDKVKRPCNKCRKILKNEPYCVQYHYRGLRNLTIDLRCWRCWHTAEVTQLFLDKWPKLFGRDKYRQWYYLCLDSDQFHFPSTDGEHDPDW